MDDARFASEIERLARERNLYRHSLELDAANDLEQRLPRAVARAREESDPTRR